MLAARAPLLQVSRPAGMKQVTVGLSLSNGQDCLLFLPRNPPAKEGGSESTVGTRVGATVGRGEKWGGGGGGGNPCQQRGIDSAARDARGRARRQAKELAGEKEVEKRLDVASDGWAEGPAAGSPVKREEEREQQPPAAASGDRGGEAGEADGARLPALPPRPCSRRRRGPGRAFGQ